jgi:MtN3 and saliva related transmembrane protein
MDITTMALGSVAGTLTTLSFLPQVIRTWRTKSAEDLSLPMLAASTVGLACWLFYGIRIDSLPIIVTNGVTFILAGTSLILKLRYG